MGYMLLYVIQGSDSVSDPYIRRGAHPPPHRHRPRVPAKLTHNHATGFPWRPCRGSLLGRPLLRYPASRQWFDSGGSVMLHTRYRRSLWQISASVIFFSANCVERGGHCFEEGCEISFPLICVSWWRTRRRARESVGTPEKIWHPAEDPHLQSFGKCSLLNSNAMELILIR